MCLHTGICWEASQDQSDKANRVSSRKALQDSACKVFLGSQNSPKLGIWVLKSPQTCWPRGDLLDPVT